MIKKRFLNTASFICGLITGVIILIIAVFFYNLSAKEPNLQSDLFAVHGCDVFVGYNPEILYYVEIPNPIPLLDRIQLLANKISRLKFGRRPITVVKIDLRQHKKIAIIDLHDREVPLSEHGTWYYSFQGTAGGISSWITLTKSFLQKDYQGEWIDGVEFLYNGKQFTNDQWDHIHLEGTFMQDE